MPWNLPRNLTIMPRAWPRDLIVRLVIPGKQQEALEHRQK